MEAPEPGRIFMRFRRRHMPNRSRRRFLLGEALESRQLLAGELGFRAAPESAAIAAVPAIVATDTLLHSNLQAEGEQAADLVAFARNLAAAGVVYYGAPWCPACSQQHHLFDDGATELPFVNVTNPDRSLNEVGIAEGIEQFPHWKFPDESFLVGVQTLEMLSERSGVAIPQSDIPSFKQVGDTNVAIGSPLHIPIDAYDPGGGPLTVTVSIDDPSVVEAEVITGNRSIRIDMENYGDMVFELFEQRAPVAASRVIELAESSFYDGILFHRIADGFVIQGGDPTGTGASGSDLGPFDDDFHRDLQHNREGVLSFAKSSDDTNNSQFFVTEVPIRFLDFNHSVFGQLIEGFDVREAISSASTPESRGMGSSQMPDVEVVIDTIEVFEDTENSLVMLTGIQAGTTAVTLTVTDAEGNTFAETVEVTVGQDFDNSQPFLNPIEKRDYLAGEIATVQLTSTDIEGDPVAYGGQYVSDSAGSTATLDPGTGLLQIVPASGFTGTISVEVFVVEDIGNMPNRALTNRDSQRLDFTFVTPPFHLADNPYDVDGNGTVTAGDALRILNAITRNGGTIDVLAATSPQGLDATFGYNVTADGIISSLDALAVINQLAILSAVSSVESEEVVEQGQQRPMFVSEQENALEGRDLAILEYAQSGLF